MVLPKERLNIPFLTQLAHGNTREHLCEGDEKGPRVRHTRWLPGLTDLSFSLNGVDLVSRPMELKVRDEPSCTFCTLHKTVLRSFVLGLDWVSGSPGSGFAALS